MIVAELVQRDFDGLANPQAECGCSVQDLAPCGSISQDCVAALLVACQDCQLNFYVPPDTLEKLGGRDYRCHDCADDCPGDAQ